MNDWLVKSLSRKHIHVAAENLRCLFGFGNSYVPNICGVLEHHLPNLLPNYQFEIVDMIELENGGQAEAQTAFDPPRVTFRTETYLQLVKDDPHARFTAAHEIGHLFLHEGLRALNRMPEKSKSIFQSRSAEWQANEFAAAFLAPEHMLRCFDCPEEAAAMMCISLRTAQIRMTELRLWPKNRDTSAWSRLRKEMKLDNN